MSLTVRSCSTTPVFSSFDGFIAARKVRRLMAFQTLTLPGERMDEQTRDLKWEDRKRLAQRIGI